MRGPEGDLGPQVPGTTTLVYGSYPPVPGLAARATRAEVEKAWEAGELVTVVSPRSSAAHVAVRIAGPLSGRRLDNVRRVTGATRLVFCAEAHVPVPIEGRWLVRRVGQLLTVRQLVVAFGAFEHVALVVTGDLGVATSVVAPLFEAADEVRRGDAVASAVPDLRLYPPSPVAALGAPEIRWQDWAQRAVRLVAYRVFGVRAPMVVGALMGSARLARRAVRGARRWAGPAPGGQPGAAGSRPVRRG